jgi:ABC-type nitrate/sulfonate/bicarbonate transport system permease component
MKQRTARKGGRAATELPVKVYAAPGVPAERALPPATILSRIRDNMGLAQVTAVNLTVFFLLWEYIYRIELFPPIFFPGPSRIVQEYVAMISDGSLVHHATFSFTNLAIGFTISAVIGVSVGLLAGTFRWLNTILMPYYWSLNSMPNLAIVPLIVLWFGFGMESKIILIVLNGTLPILINTLAGVYTVDPVLIRVARAMNASRLQRYYKVVIPFTLPFILTGFKQGMSVSLTTTVVSEMLGSARGLGYVIIRKVEAFNPAGVFAMLLLLAAVALIMVNGMQWVQYRVTPWSRHVRL